jgi:hypothetical protein
VSFDKRALYDFVQSKPWTRTPIFFVLRICERPGTDMKLRLTRTTILLFALNEIRGFAMVAPALLAALKAHHLL